MFFTILGLVSAMLFGMFFGSEGALPQDLQDFIFFGLILTGLLLHSLQIIYQRLCRHCRWWFCGHPRSS